MRVREATAADAAEVLSFVRAKAQVDRELGPTSAGILARPRTSSDSTCSAHGRSRSCCWRANLERPLGSLVLFSLLVVPGSSEHLAGRPFRPPARPPEARGPADGPAGRGSRGNDCTHIAWVASANNSIGMGFYRRLGTTIVHQAGDAVTLQIGPAAVGDQRPCRARC